MAKLPPRIPSEQVQTATSWALQDLADGQVSKILRTKKSEYRQKTQLLAKKTFAGETRPRPKSRQHKNAIIKTRQPKTASKTVDEVVEKDHSQTRVEPIEPEVPHPTPDSVEAIAVEPEQADPPTDETAEPRVQEIVEPLIDRGEDAGFAEGFKKGETEGYVQGEQKGYSAGMEAGGQAGRADAEASFNQEVATQKETLTNLIRALSEPPNHQAEIEESLTGLVTEIAQVVLMAEIKTHPDHIIHLVREAIAALPHNTSDPSVYLNPTDISFVQESIAPDIKLIADAGLARGGCRVETQESQIEATLSGRLRSALTAAFNQATLGATESELQEIDSAIDPE